MRKKEDILNHFSAALEEIWPEEVTNEVLVAVSGGGDSMALMDLTASWLEQNKNKKCQIITVDHKIRKASNMEAEFVAEKANSLGLKHRTLKWEGWDGSGNLQKSAREARYKLIAKVAPKNSVVLTGHTKNDQAETFLMNLKRGSGVDGLAGIPHRRLVLNGENRFWLLRPLLGVMRQTLRDYLRVKKLTWIEDPSNEDESYDRVKIRKSVNKFMDLGISTDLLAKTASHMFRAKKALQDRAEEIAQEIVRSEKGVIKIRRTDFESVEQEYQYRLLAASLCWVSSKPYKPRFLSLERLLKKILSSRSQRSLHGCIINSKRDDIIIFREIQSLRKLETAFKPGCLWDKKWVLTLLDKKSVFSDWKIRVLDHGGAKQLNNELTKNIDLPIIMVQPGVFWGDNLICAPSLEKNIYVSATFCAKPFIELLNPY